MTLDITTKTPKLTRRSMQAPTFKAECFFCERSEDIINRQTVELDRNVCKMAEALEDSKILAKLAEGDVCNQGGLSQEMFNGLL